MGEENCIEDPGQDGYRSLGKILQGSIRYTVGARNLTKCPSYICPDFIVRIVRTNEAALFSCCNSDWCDQRW